MRKKLWILVLLIAGGLQMLQAQSPEQVARLQDLAAQLKQKSQAEKAEAVRVANQKGWPVRTVDENGRITELMRLDEKGMPVYYTTYNANGAALINSDELYTGGAAGLSLSGSGQTLGIWDGGDVRTTHVELTGRITDKDGVSPDGIEDHPTHVAGTMIASGVDAAAKGMSFAASLDAYDWTDDEAEMIAAAADGLNVSQHSYGQIAGWAQGSWSGNYGWHWFGDYTIDESENYFWGYYSNEAQYWDYISQISPNYLIVKSAGNDRGEGITSGAHYAYKYSDGTWVSSSTARLKDGGTTGYQTVAHSATSKNVMTVGAVDNTTAMSSFSGWGPTDDGRIKPDIVAKGVSVYSSLADADNNSYASWNGTSMSGPMVSGSVGLLLEHQENLHPGVTLRSATMKGLILHTATDLGNAGPDYVYGWGLMNTQAAAEVMTDNASGGNHIVETSLSNGATKTYYIEATGGEPVVATIIWTDPYGAVPTPSLNPTDLILVNDLDMQIEDASSTVFNPYILDPANPGNAATTGDNIRDNIEKIVIASPTAGGVYAITISHKATLNGGSQDYSLIITGNTSLSTTTTLPYAETFDTDLGDCYTYSVSGDTKYWEWANFEGNGYARMNGYNSGETEEDWLILPGINADDYTTITMSFETAYNFGTNDADNYLKLFYSTDYIGVGDPNDATWTELAFTQPVAGNYVYVNSGDIDLSAISGQFYLAFKYRGTNGSYRAWQIDNINIFQELITFYFRGPDWMDNNPHNPEVWGPFNGWSTGTMTYDNSLEWWKTTVQVADAAAEITYQSRFAEGGVTKYQKAFGDFGANPTFTTSTGEIWIDASDNASFAWSGNDFYLAQDNITETQPLIAEPANHVTNLAITADSESQISLSWTDSDAAYYLIKGSAVGYADISDPVDGTAEADALLVKNVGSSIQSVSFSGLDAATTYYFKVFPYNGTGSIVNYKTDGTVPQESAATNSLPYYYAGMEGDEETKGSYASGTVTISNVQWDLTEALIGTLASDYKTGIRSVRMRGYGTSAMTMLEDKANGIGSIYFNYRRYGTDAQVDWKVEYSTDGGSNWTQIGSVFTAPDSDEVQTFHEKVNVDGNIRLR
ncbi:MAG: S8 family serine peptidase, partial [Bacteroidetes bacterium]|nr:S8 family serine peptidase [Bacteroidota bacterium]MBU1578911.1 S8 family serine peptidase [Bacteroidota bacterium]